MPRHIPNDELDALADEFQRLRIGAFGVRLDDYVRAPGAARERALKRLRDWADNPRIVGVLARDGAVQTRIILN